MNVLWFRLLPHSTSYSKKEKERGIAEDKVQKISLKNYPEEIRPQMQERHDCDVETYRTQSPTIDPAGREGPEPDSLTGPTQKIWMAEAFILFLKSSVGHPQPSPTYYLPQRIPYNDVLVLWT